MPEQNNAPETRHVTGRVLLGSPGRETTLQSGPLGGRREYDCIFMQPGRVLRADGTESTWLIPAETIRRSGHLFDSVSVYLDHPEQFGLWGEHQSPKVKDLAGVTFNVRWDDSQNALIGGIRLYDKDPNSPGAMVGALMDQILQDLDAGREVPPIGLSAVFYHQTSFDEESGLRITTDIQHAESVDFVYSAGARGYVRAALARIRGERDGSLSPESTQGATLVLSSSEGPAPNSTQGGNHMPEEDILTPDQGQQEAPQEPEPGSVTLTTLHDHVTGMEQTIANLQAQLAQTVEAQTVQGMGDPPRSPIRSMLAGVDQVTQALDAMLAGVRPPDGIRPLTGIRELYHLMSGDYEMTGVYQPERVYLANVTSATMAGMVANRLNKLVINQFMSYPQWWAPAVTVQDFATLQDVRWITLGGVGELPTVNEGAAYTELTWDDQTETAAFIKKGGYLGITLEAIDKDDTRRLRAAPSALAQGAWLTLGKSISAIFTANAGVGPAMSDAVALFNAAHGNLGSTALSVAAWKATKIAMMKQTELHSAERLGALTAPKLIWVPVDLEDTAIVILASAGESGTANNDINPYAQGEARETRINSARARVITCPLWTETDHWAAQADPNLYPSIGIGFRYGRTPEIFSVADPRAGLMFSNDVMPIKVRFLYAVGATDWRGLYKHNV